MAREKKEKKGPVYKVATEDLYLDGRRVYKKGDRVAADTAEKRGWADKVVGENTKSAKEARHEADEDKTTRGFGNVVLSPDVTDADEKARERDTGDPNPKK